MKRGKSAATPAKDSAARDASLAALRKKAEEKLKLQTDRLDELSKQDIKKLIHELGTFQIELEMQNEELRRAQMKLLDSRHRYAELYDFAPTGYFTVDPQGAILSANLIGAAMLTVPRNELAGKPFILFILEEDRDVFYRYNRKLLQKGNRRSCELRLLGKDDGFFYGRLDGAAVRDNRGNISEIRIPVSDISERKRAVEELVHERSVLAGIMNATDVMLAYLDPGFNFVWVNPAYAEGCQRRPEELIGKNHFALFPHAENEAIFRRVRDTGKSVFFKDKPFEFPDQPERGVTFWDWSLVPVKNDEGEVRGLVFSQRETTKYKLAELALAASEGRFRRMAEISADIIFQIDPAGVILYASPAVRSFGYEPEQVVGEPFAKFIPPAELPKAMEALKRMNSGESISLFEVEVLKGDGTIADCEVNATPIIREGVVVGMQGMVRDITDRKRMETALESSMKRFELLASTAGELLRATEPQTVVESICRQVMAHLDCHFCFHFLASGQEGRSRLNVCVGIPEDELREVDWLNGTDQTCGGGGRQRPENGGRPCRRHAR